MKVWTTKNLFHRIAVTVGLGLLLAGRIKAQTSTTLHDFKDIDITTWPWINSDGALPGGGLTFSGKTLYGTMILLSNSLYGTSQVGGISGVGTVFKVNTDGTGFEALYGFTSGSDGAQPYAGLVFSPDAGRIVSSSGGDDALRLWVSKTPLEVGRVFGSHGGFAGCAFSLDGNSLYSASRDGEVRVWHALPLVQPEAPPR
jgi:uncharacterized repeat protein (TIGR03803 family)